MKTDIIVFLFRVAALQGLFLAFSLLFKKAKTPANQTLGIWMILLSLDLFFQSLIVDIRELVQYPVMVGIVNGLPLIHGPMMFLYTRFVTGSRKPGLKDLFHFTPFILSKICIIPYYMLSNTEKMSFLESMLHEIPLSLKVFNIIVAAQGFSYAILSYLIIKEHRKKVLEYFSYKERVILQWLRVILIINFMVWIMVVIGDILLFFIKEPIYNNWPIYLLVCLMIYATGYLGFNYSIIFPEKMQEVEPGTDSVSETVSSEKNAKYEKTKLSDEKKNKIKEDILKQMQSKIWLEPELTIKDISNALNVPIHQVSQVINDNFKANFFTFINGYRLEEAKNRLHQKDFQDHSILQIALDCGFNSKSSFNSLFKENTGLTPTEFRRQN